jgi:glycosyltransferase involved in cell wall biosynthesis
LKEKAPFFSIIIPTYNSEKLLSKALDSVLRQNYDDYEVVIMDGLSSDDTVKKAKVFALKDDRFKVYSGKDEGIYDAMNKGIEKARGFYLYFLGSDDTFYKDNVLTTVYLKLCLSPVDILYGNVYSERFKGLHDGAFTPDKLYKKNICHQSIFLKKSIFNITGLFNLKYKAHADYDHNIKWFFSKRIKHSYHDIIIANYADGGFSSVNGDPVFQRNKKNLFFYRAICKVSWTFFLKNYFIKTNSYLKRIYNKVRRVLNFNNNY